MNGRYVQVATNCMSFDIEAERKRWNRRRIVAALQRNSLRITSSLTTAYSRPQRTNGESGIRSALSARLYLDRVYSSTAQMTRSQVPPAKYVFKLNFLTLDFR
jgi:hypothetical protein